MCILISDNSSLFIGNDYIFYSYFPGNIVLFVNFFFSFVDGIIFSGPLCIFNSAQTRTEYKKESIIKYITERGICFLHLASEIDISSSHIWKFLFSSQII